MTTHRRRPLSSAPPLLAAVLVTLAPTLAMAQDQAAPADPTLLVVNNLWMLISALLVFIMHLGFSTLEAGLAQSKNTVNILFKNVSILSIGVLTYAAVGFGLMYPGKEFAGGFFEIAGFGLATDAAGLTSAYNPGYTYWTDFLFQAMFAATAATIVSGAVAERVKLKSFLVFGAIYVALIYPMVGMWQWGGGWLSAQGFHDFAGSTIVHSVGGWAALVAVWMLGPRIGRFGEGGEVREIKPHSLPLATIGVFLLWFGWFGFNGGSVLSADPGAVSLVFTTTTLSAAAGGGAAAALSQFTHGKPDLSMALNGVLAGLVGITAGADVISPSMSIVVGAIAGVLVIVASMGLDRLKMDDPVGAIPVHLVCGIWGTLAVGLFAPDKSLVAQLLGVAAVGGFCIAAAFAILVPIKLLMGLRVTAHEELVGLDLEEHGAQAYHGLALPEVVVAGQGVALTDPILHTSLGGELVEGA